MTSNVRVLESMAARYMEVAYGQFLLRFPRQARNGMVRWGAWSNATGLVIAFLTYRPWKDPADESIDVVISFVPGNDALQFAAVIGWSDGEVLAVIEESAIVAHDADCLLRAADAVCRSASERIMPELTLLLAADSSATP